ncbi:DNA-binding sugar fermentation-stimulating protein [Pseudomonas psychrotolerans]|nr:DNA-binding sugar fermentation-stimulating protein [Pseudomonas psychrotolerans]
MTTRGARHLRELAALAAAGERAVLLYCVLLDGIEAVRPAAEIDAAYALALGEARRQGVQVLAYGARLSPAGLQLDRALRLAD